MKSKKNIEHRRHARVTVLGEELRSVLGLDAELIWPNEESSLITDLSYRGAAVKKPGLLEFKEQESFTVKVRLGLNPAFSIRVKVAWFDSTRVGLEMLDLAPEGQLAIWNFLEVKLVGAQMRRIERSLYGPLATFDIWFQGAQGQAVFVWLNDQRSVERVRVELLDATIELDRARPLKAVTPDVQRAFLVLSQLDKTNLPMKEFLRTVSAGV